MHNLVRCRIVDNVVQNPGDQFISILKHMRDRIGKKGAIFSETYRTHMIIFFIKFLYAGY